MTPLYRLDRDWHRDNQIHRIYEAPKVRRLWGRIQALIREKPALLYPKMGRVALYSSLRPGLCFGFVTTIVERLQSGSHSSIQAVCADRAPFLTRSIEWMAINVLGAKLSRADDLTSRQRLISLNARLPAPSFTFRLGERKIESLAVAMRLFPRSVIAIHCTRPGRFARNHSLCAFGNREAQVYELFDSDRRFGLYRYSDGITWERQVVSRFISCTPDLVAGSSWIIQVFRMDRSVDTLNK